MTTFHKKKYVLLTVLMVFSLLIMAGGDTLKEGPPQFVQANPYPVDIVQPDGTELTIRKFGDEVINYTFTIDDYTLLPDDKSVYYYAELDENGDLVISKIKANNPNKRKNKEKKFLKKIHKELTYSKKQKKEKKDKWNNGKSGGKSLSDAKFGPIGNSFPTTGTRKMLVILTEFTNKSFTKSQSTFENLLNGSSNSFRDYYMDTSYGNLIVNSTVVGPYDVGYSMQEADATDWDNQRYFSACVDAAEADGINFAEYDNDNDGYVDGVYFIFAGYGQEAGGPSYAIWSHSWTLGNYAKNYDGVTISKYACSPELRGASGTTTTGIGVICHEFGHNLGVPDYYDTDYGDNGQSFDIGRWDVMASGSWNDGGDTPSQHNMYTKWKLGWSNPTVITGAATLSLGNTMDNNEAYRIDTATTGEFFILENRQQTGWDAAVPGHGMLIIHVDGPFIDNLSSNTINILPSHQGLDVEEADNIRSSATYGGDPFPGTSNKTSFTDTTTPNSKSWAGANTGKPVTNISESSGVITFDFMGGAPAQLPPVANFNASGTTINEGQVVNFTDTSVNSPTSWTWSFPGGTPSSSTAQNPSVTYNSAGNYNVTLTATNAYGNDTEIKTGYITVTEVQPTVGNTTVFSSTSTASNRRAMGFTMPEDGTISSISMYHNGGSGSMILGVYSDASAPANRLGVTPSTTVSGSTGWQTISLTSPVFVSSGTKIWLAWVYESNPGIKYETGSPGRVDAGVGWSAGMPDPFGGSSQAGYNYSIFANYTPGGGTVNPPVAAFNGSPTLLDEGQSVTFTDLSSNNPTSWAWSFPGGTPSSSTAQNPVITYNTAGTYPVTLTATNSAGNDDEVKNAYITVQTPTVTYCTSQGNNYSYEFIKRVQVGDLDNSSSGSSYTDFTHLNANLSAGSQVSVSLTPDFPRGGSYVEYWKIWIDYNHDGDFTDAGEEVFSGSGSSIVTGSFTVATGVSGTTRMRVSMKWNGAPAPCESFSYGEVEDYTVNLL